MAASDDQPGFTVEEGEAGQTLASLLRRRGLAGTWNDARRAIAGGKVTVDGAAVTDPVLRPRPGSAVVLSRRARRPATASPAGRIVFDDSQVVLLDKPAGISSVPYDEREVGTAMDLLRDHWRRAGRAASEVALHVVHRIDKDTSGLLLFAKTRAAERALQERFRAHDIERTYLCVAHGHVAVGASGELRIESRLVEDRGDGLRGSLRPVPGASAASVDRRQRAGEGKLAITHVRVLEHLGELATLCEVRLETGKTHQIRIHLAEKGHPLVGERVYVRDFTRAGHALLPSPRLLLHAATLGFVHPLTGELLRFESPLPPEITATVAELRARALP